MVEVKIDDNGIAVITFDDAKPLSEPDMLTKSMTRLRSRNRGQGHRFVVVPSVSRPADLKPYGRTRVTERSRSPKVKFFGRPLRTQSP